MDMYLYLSLYLSWIDPKTKAFEGFIGTALIRAMAAHNLLPAPAAAGLPDGVPLGQG